MRLRRMVRPLAGVRDVLRWTVYVSTALTEKRGIKSLCNRVLITSRGCTAKVDIVPAERPAIVSTSAGEMRAWFSVIREDLCLSL